MNNYELIDILGKAFSDGKMDTLAEHIADDCEYVSEYANITVVSAEKIISRMNEIISRVTDDCRYSYQIIQLESVLREKTLSDLDTIEGLHLCEYGLLLYQFDDESLVAVVSIMIDTENLIRSIILSRNKTLYDVSFFEEEAGEDSPLDLPSTVMPLTPHDLQVKEMRRSFSGQHLDDIPENTDSDLYIWRKADDFIKGWLKDNGYVLRESRIFDDCIGYRCNQNDYAYTVYMYAYGQNRTTQLDAKYCRKLLHYDLSKKSTILVVYLNVQRFKNGEDMDYAVYHYSGDEDNSIELWRLNEVNEQLILEYYPRKEMMDTAYKLMYAFNRDCLDVYDCIIAENNPEFHGVDDEGISVNSAFYTALHGLYKKYGEMKIGYVRFNDVVYSLTPYLDGYGYFGFRMDNNTNRIIEITAYPFEGGESKATEFIRTQERESDKLYSRVPALIKVAALSPVATERFALKLFYDNGKCKKYVLPIEPADEKEEVVSFRDHVFTNKIWASAKTAAHRSAEIKGYPDRGSAVEFVNGFFVSAMLCYEEGTDYTEPVVCNETIYKGQGFIVKRLWKWRVNSLYEDEETGLFKTLISGMAFNYYGVSTFATVDGRRLCSIDFDFIDDFKEGLARVGKSGHGYGFVDKDMNFVIPMVYHGAENFQDGTAKVKRRSTWYRIDKSGKEREIAPNTLSAKYQEVWDYHEGMCKVSTLKIRGMDLAYHSDYAEIAGTWGYVNEAGDEIVAPQYIYASDFFEGMAIVCKGEWTIDKKWDNKYNKGRYWTEQELWGAIDKVGNEVIPFVFDEIKFFNDVNDVFIVHYGGWDSGHWGVIDKHGQWLAEPVFERIDYEYHDGFFAFYKEDRCGDNVPLGIYDIKQRKVIFEPQFYDVSFRDDGWIEVEVYDEELGRRVEKIIDINGKEKFHSVYSSIYTWKEPYEVMIRDDSGDRHGLIDKDGHVLLPCKYDVAWGGASYEKKRIVFKENGKQGVCDFDDNVIIPAQYYEIHGIDNPLLTVRVGVKDKYKEGLITHDGREVVPAMHKRISWCSDNKIICCNDGHCEMLRFELM